MCGYCVEVAISLGFLKQDVRNDVQAEWDENQSFYLLESDHFPEVIRKLKNFRIFPEDIPIAFSRIWERSLSQEADNSYQLLISRADGESINSFLISIRDNGVNRAFAPSRIRISILIVVIGHNLSVTKMN